MLAIYESVRDFSVGQIVVSAYAGREIGSDSVSCIVACISASLVLDPSVPSV